MKTAHLTIDPAFRIGPVRRHTFGSFVEHLGRCVYTGIHDPAIRQLTRTGSAAT